MTLTSWQRTNIIAAWSYLKDIGQIAQNPQPRMLAQGLMEVLEPSRRTIRLQREAAQAASAGAQSGHERRTRERRRDTDRRRQALPYSGPDRRSGLDRRSKARRSSQPPLSIASRSTIVPARATVSDIPAGRAPVI